MTTPDEALERLSEGNRRYMANLRSLDTLASYQQRAAYVAGQDPFAVILGCSDSRVPVEIVFDQGLGDLFVIRVAGNIVAPSQIGSVEFAVAAFGAKLVVVLGHTLCGAVRATVNELRNPTTQSPNLRSIVDRVRPAVSELVDRPDLDDEALMERAVRANIRASANQLRHSSAMLEPLVASGELLIVGAEYSLETGEVEFFDGVDGH